MGMVSGFLKYKGLKKGINLIKKVIQKDQPKKARVR